MIIVLVYFYADLGLFLTWAKGLVHLPPDQRKDTFVEALNGLKRIPSYK